MATRNKKATKGKNRTDGRRSGRAKAAIELDSAIYKKAALEKAAEGFAGLSTISIKRKGKFFRVEFDAMSVAVARKLPDEFANYALALVVNES